VSRVNNKFREKDQENKKTRALSSSTNVGLGSFLAGGI
jgi:hypothetical protein